MRASLIVSGMLSSARVRDWISFADGLLVAAVVGMLVSGDVAASLFGFGSGDAEVDERSIEEMMLVA